MDTFGVNMGDVKTTNRACVLGLLLSKGAMSRTDIAMNLHLTTATLTSICNDFIAKGLLLQTEDVTAPSKVGRKKYPLEINYNRKYVVAIDIHPKRTVISITNLRGDLIDTELLHPNQALGPEEFLRLIASSSIRMMWSNSLTNDDVLGAGVTVIGPVNQELGISLHAFNLFEGPVNIKEILEKEFDFPVCVESNVIAYLGSELLYGNIEEIHTALLLKWGPGVGSASCINGKLYKGSNYHSSEVGHTCVDPEGQLCQCGKTGCLETKISIDAFVEYVEDFQSADKGLAQLISAHGLPNVENIDVYLKSENRLIMDFFENAASYLATVVDNSIQMLAPDKIIVYGDFFENDHITSSFIHKVLSLDPHLSESLFVKSGLTDKRRYIGAVAVAVKGLLIDSGGELN